MFDLSFGEVMLVVVAAVIFIGPKELPVVVKAVAGAMQAIRSLMGELRGAFHDLAEESGFEEAKREFEQDVKMIRGDDGDLYESYDLTKVMTPAPRPQLKDFASEPTAADKDD